MPIRSHSFHYHLPRMTEMKRLFLTHSVGSLGASLAAIFVPLFLLTEGYAFTAVLFYLLLQHLFATVFQYPACWILSRIGGNKGVIIAQVSCAMYYGLLLTLPEFHWPLALIAFAWSLDRMFYSASFHANFSKSRAHEKTGTEVSLFTSIIAVTHGIAPAIGGFIASSAGIGWNYALAIALLLVSTIPMFKGAEVTSRRNLDLRRLNLRKIWRDPVSNVFNGMTTVSEFVFWPLIIFFIVKTYVAVGILSSIVLVASILISFYVGKREVTKGERHYLRRGLLVESITNVFRAIAQNASHIFGVNLLNGVGRSLYVTPYMTRYYRHADEEPRFEYIALMETANLLGGTILLGVVVLLAQSYPAETVLLTGVILAVPASFGTRLIR